MGLERRGEASPGETGAHSGRGLRPPALRRSAQVTVELLLVLPVFMLMLFFIMEMGNIAYQVILVHHSAYELARIGSLAAGARGGDPNSGRSADCDKARIAMRATLAQMNFRRVGQMQVDGQCVETGRDPQPASVPRIPLTHINEDLEVTLAYPAQLVFPGSSYFLADNKRQGTRTISVKVRMPIEKPLFQ